MTRYHQTRSNNCVQTCLASIFDVPIEEAPDIFFWTDERRKALTKWTNTHGRKAAWIAASSERCVRALEKSGEYYIGIGPAGGANNHAVVMRHGELAHDPWGGPGLTGPPVAYIRFEREPESGCGVILIVALGLIIWAMLSSK